MIAAPEQSANARDVTSRQPERTAVSGDAHRLWIAMWSRADDSGVFRADPRKLARRVLRIDDARAVAGMLAELERARLIDACSSRGWRGVQLRGSTSEQSPAAPRVGMA